MANLNSYMKAGDTDDLVVQLYDAKRVPLVLLPLTTGIFKMRNKATGIAQTMTGVVTVDQANGLLTYAWAAGETAVAADNEAQFVLTMPTGKVQTVPKYGFINVIISPTF
jgi:hypothetical protein